MVVGGGRAAGSMDTMGWVRFIDMCRVAGALGGGGRSKWQRARFMARVDGGRGLNWNGVRIVVSQCAQHARDAPNRVSDRPIVRVPKR